MNIAERWGNIKSQLDQGLAEWGVFVCIFLIGVGSFGLGRLSVLEQVRPPVSIKAAPQSASPEALHVGGLIVASAKGSVYYYPWCSGALKIAEDSALWFESELSAQKAGFVAAKTCPGLSEQ